MSEWECENCGADMRCRHDPEGVGNYMGGEHGWVCDCCEREIEIERIEMDDKLERKVLTVTMTVEAHPQHTDNLRQDLEDAAKASIEFNRGYLLDFTTSVKETSDG